MPCYLISYDLVKERNYEELFKTIKGFSNWARITESTWAVVSSLSAKEVRDKLLKVMDNDDRLFVLRSGREAAWGNVLCNDDWLAKNL